MLIRFTHPGRPARDELRLHFERWASLVREGCDLTVAAIAVTGEQFWRMLDEMLCFPTVRADLVRNLSYGKNWIFVRFLVRDARGDVMFSC